MEPPLNWDSEDNDIKHATSGYIIINTTITAKDKHRENKEYFSTEDIYKELTSCITANILYIAIPQGLNIWKIGGLDSDKIKLHSQCKAEENYRDLTICFEATTRNLPSVLWPPKVGQGRDGEG